MAKEDDETASFWSPGKLFRVTRCPTTSTNLHCCNPTPHKPFADVRPPRFISNALYEKRSNKLDEQNLTLVLRHQLKGSIFTSCMQHYKQVRDVTWKGTCWKERIVFQPSFFRVYLRYLSFQAYGIYRIYHCNFPYVGICMEWSLKGSENTYKWPYKWVTEVK